MNVFDILLERGFIAKNPDGSPRQVTDLKIKDTLSEKKITAYIGFDPSASSLHVGNLIPIMTLAHLQRSGHRIIVIVGGGTGMIGDPSGKTELRKLLTAEDVARNMESQKKQFMRFIDFSSEDRALMLNNADWLSPINYIDFLRDIGRHFSINRMMAAESVKQRLEKGLSFLEFNYMLLQAYDFLHLFQKQQCILQMGGDDQWGNICAGIDLIRRVTGEEAYGFTYPLLTTASGRKMGKTEEGAVWIDDQSLKSVNKAAYKYYHFWRNVDDRDVERFLALFTFLPMEEVKKLGQATGSELNRAKEILAFEATRLNYGEQAAYKAEKSEKQLFSGEGGGNETPSVEIDHDRIKKGVWIVELFHEAGLASSRSDARRLIKNGGAYVNREKVSNIDLQIDSSHLQENQILLRAGKKKYVRVVPK